MAQGKKSVLLYVDIIHTVEALTDEEAGILFKHYLRYVNDLNPTAPDKLTQIVFEPIKQTLKRDLEKWNNKSERNRDIANEAWKKRKDANAYESKKTDTKNTDSDSVNVSDSVSVNVKDKINTEPLGSLSESFETFWNLYDKKVDRVVCEKKWAKIKPSLHDTIFDHVKRYVAATPDKQIRKNPETYLNREAWENEIIDTKQQFTQEAPSDY